MVSVSVWTLWAALGAGGETVLLDFTAPWCGPCRSMEPAIHRLQAEGHPVRQINIDEQPQLAARFGVRSVPCLIMLVDGHEVDRTVGAVGYDRLLQMLRVAAAAPTREPPALEIRGQSPDRPGLGGRLRQMVGGRHAAGELPSQPSATPPAASGAEPLASAYAAPAAPGPEPPAILGNLAASPASAYVPPSPSIPPRESDYPVVPGASVAAPPQAWEPPSAATPGAATRFAPQEQAMGASVRLRIDDGQFYSYATGTVIAALPTGEALILTCGHVFRDSQGRGAISVELFGPHRQGPLSGRLVAYDLNRDLGLVGVRTASNLAPMPVAGGETYLREGLRVFSIGCDRGAEPSVREGRIAGVNRYLGTPNLVVTGQPVIGRSGGGLFDADGRLIGVCRAADGQADEGVYVSYQAVATQLREWGVADIISTRPQPAALAQATQPPAADAYPAGPVSPGSDAVADRPADFDYTQAPAPTPHPGAMASPRLPEVGSVAEPVFIVRAGGAGSGDVMVVERPSPAFLEQLARENAVRLADQAQVPPVVRAAAETLRASPVAAPLMRGQSPFPPGAAALR